ncbi:hypothetical protein BVC93_21035 [Mycobacterium sp. MS1601]|uniref:serine/threonine-protein kinase n=1 Tax=Mycobacterium sp. MS1601 TaxID=1936029 RepID=UPI0009797FA9|nr:serine/threonine-protein kinase [Mycobacterium sp. MS1601]AQA04501.1 hypothetical protein BVC93_21035 [Mycobacterium sp. MS1601]
MVNNRVGSRIGPYELTRLLGRGGMGEVYEARDTAKDRTVALKLLPPELSHNSTFRKRLEREARSAGKLQEPHVVPIHDFGEIDGQLFVDMRLIDGVDLRSVLNRGGPMPPARAVSIVRQIASALDAAHGAGVTHRDVKPENILVTAEDFAYLVDFGIANAATDDTLTEQGTAIGTFAYMAPERFTNDHVDQRADIYSLACVLYECLTGTKPFRSDSVSVLITAHLMEPAPRPSLVLPGLPQTLDAVVAQGMAKNPAERFATAGDMARAAESTLSFAAPPPPPVPVRHRGRTVAVVLAAVAVLAAAVAATWTLRSPETAVTSTLTITRTVTSTPKSSVSLPAHEAVTPVQRRVLAAVPSGYQSCEPVRPPVADALATVDCGQNAMPGGPATARYSLFPTVEALDSGFRAAIDEDTVVDCPGGRQSPGTWDYDSTPGQTEGSVACGDFDGNPEVVWTKSSDLMLGIAQGTDLETVHQWWVDYV